MLQQKNHWIKSEFLLSGRVKALEEYITGDIYIFTRFNPPEIFGEMEAITDFPFFRASLITETDCICATIPVAMYLKYLQNNPDILYSRVQTILKRISNDQRDNRFYLMLSSTDRIKIYLVQHFKQSNNNESYVLRKTRQQIADETRYSVKTVNRVIKKLIEEDLLGTIGQKIVLTNKQYNILMKSINEKGNYSEREL